nr:putative reverse transcriptase domain-containing protein [Tanacetum cinerariifolium]
MIKDSVDAAIAVEQASAILLSSVVLKELSNCKDEGKKVKFIADTLEGPALNWWKTKVATIGLETVKVYDVVAYSQWFNELALMCPRMVEPKRVKVDAYIQGLTDNIKGEMTSSKPADPNEAIRMAHKLMEQKLKARDARILERKKIVNSKEMCELWLPPLLMESFLCVNDVLLAMLASVRSSVTSVEMLGIRQELGTFDVIIGMDWLVKHDVIIVFGKKVVHIQYVNEMLIVKSDRGVSRLKFISCINAHKYVERGCHLFLAHVTESKSKEKRMDDVPVIHDFPEVFPEEFPGLPPPKQVDFRIDLVAGDALVTRAPYRLAPSEMIELSVQLQKLLEKGFIFPSSSPWGASVLFVKIIES